MIVVSTFDGQIKVESPKTLRELKGLVEEHTGIPASEQIICTKSGPIDHDRPITNESLHLVPRMRGGCMLYCSSEQSSEMTNEQRMVNSFLSSVNKSATAQAIGIQNMDVGNVTIKGDGSDISFEQTQKVTAQQQAKFMSKAVDDIKASMTSDMEAVLQNDKKLGGISGGGVMTPLGGAGGGGMDGLAGSTSSSSKITNEMESILTMSDKVKETISAKAESIQSLKIGDILVEGNDNKVDFKQGALLELLQEAMIKDTKIKKVANSEEATLSNKLTMKNGKRNSIIMIVGVILMTVFFIPAILRKGKMKSLDEACPSGPDGVKAPACVQQYEQQKKSMDSGKTGKIVGVVVLVIVAILVCIAIWKFMAKAFE